MSSTLKSTLEQSLTLTVFLSLRLVGSYNRYMNLLDLPYDILIEIVASLPNRSRFLSLALVNVSLSSLVYSAPLRSLDLGYPSRFSNDFDIKLRDLSESGFSDEESERPVRKFLVEFFSSSKGFSRFRTSRVTSLRLDTVPYYSLEPIIEIFPNLVNLKVLCVTARWSSSSDTFKALSRLKKLETLSLSIDSTATFKLPYKSLRNLEIRRIDSQDEGVFLNYDSMIREVSKCLELRSLKISFLCPLNFPKLQRLEIPRHCGHKMIEYLNNATCLNLKELMVEIWTGDQYRGGPNFGRFSSLESLKISIPSDPDGPANKLSFASFELHLKKFKIISLSNIFSIETLANPGTLESLSLVGKAQARSSTDPKAFADFFRKATQVKHFSLKFDISILSISDIVTNFRTIETLKLQDTNLTVEKLAELLSALNSNNLRRLSLIGLTVDLSVMRQISGFIDLRSLRITYIDDEDGPSCISDKWILSLKSLSRLESLNISDNSLVSLRFSRRRPPKENVFTDILVESLNNKKFIELVELNFGIIDVDSDIHSLKKVIPVGAKLRYFSKGRLVDYTESKK